MTDVIDSNHGRSLLLFQNNNLQQGVKFPLHDDILLVMFLYCNYCFKKENLFDHTKKKQTLFCESLYLLNCIFMVHYVNLFQKFFSPTPLFITYSSHLFPFIQFNMWATGIWFFRCILSLYCTSFFTIIFTLQVCTAMATYGPSGITTTSFYGARAWAQHEKNNFTAMSPILSRVMGKVIETNWPT